MSNDLGEFYDKVGTGKSKGRSGGLSAPQSRGEQANALENPGAVVNSDSADGESRWSEGDGFFWRAKKTHAILPAGLYNCCYLEGIGAALRKQDLKTDDLLVLPEKNSEKIINEFDRFWTLEEQFKLFGYLYKRGFLLWGPPGSGKTSLINLMMKTIIQKYNGIIINIEEPDQASGVLSMVRKNEPERPLITIMEDLDALVERWGEAGYLNLLDGSDQINNVIHVGTTNYPERLDKRFVDRPSRFDTVVKINMPGWAAREMYFKSKFEGKNLSWWDDKELEKWTELSKGFSVAHMREMIISVCCLGQDLDDVVKRLDQMHKRKLTADSDPEAGPMGFVSNNSSSDDC
jgi:hypothetical protein